MAPFEADIARRTNVPRLPIVKPVHGLPSAGKVLSDTTRLLGGDCPWNAFHNDPLSRTVRALLFQQEKFGLPDPEEMPAIVWDALQAFNVYQSNARATWETEDRAEREAKAEANATQRNASKGTSIQKMSF